MLVGILSFIWVLFVSGSIPNGSLFSNIISMVACVFFIYLIIKKQAIVADLLAGITLWICSKLGGNSGLLNHTQLVNKPDNSTSLSDWMTKLNLEENLTKFCIYGFLIFLLYVFVSNTIKSIRERDDRINQAKQNGVASCPKCGYTSITHYPLGIPYRDGERIVHTSNVYHCNSCGHEWK